MRRALPLWLLLPFLGIEATSLVAQMPPLTVPKGQFRFDLWGEFRDSDQRFFRGNREDLGADFTVPSLGSTSLPFLLPSETRLRALGATGFAFNLGATNTTTLVNLGTTGFGLAVGITDRVTLFGTVPIVRVRVQPTLRLDASGANAGINPADPVFGTQTGQAAAGIFFQEFDRTLDSLAARISSGFYDASGQRSQAESALASGRTLRDDLRNLLSAEGQASLFLPLASSGAAAGILGTIDTFQSTANGTLSLPAFSSKPLFPSAALTESEFQDVLTRSNGPIQAERFDPIPTVSTLGDVEVGAAIRLATSASDSGGRPAFDLTAIALARLPTGNVGAPAQLFRFGSGDRQLDLEGGLVLDLVGSFWGLRAAGQYTRQFASTLQRRITSPSQPFAAASTEVSVQQDLGDIVSLQVSPFLRLASSLALHAGIRYWRKGSDSYRLAAGQDPTGLPPVSLLGEESDASATVFVAGLSFAHTGLGRRGAQKLPLDGSLEFRRVLDATGGRVTDERVVRATLRLYGRSPLR